MLEDRLMVLSAADEQALAGRLAGLKTAVGSRSSELSDIAFTLATARRAFAQPQGFVQPPYSITQLRTRVVNYRNIDARIEIIAIARHPIGEWTVLGPQGEPVGIAVFIHQVCLMVEEPLDRSAFETHVAVLIV